MKRAYLSESGHVFCPECMALLESSSVAARVVQCTHCEALFSAELETACYERAEGSVMSRITRGRGGLIAAALGMSLTLMACDEKPGGEPEAVTPRSEDEPDSSIKLDTPDIEGAEPDQGQGAGEEPEPPAKPDMASEATEAVEERKRELIRVISKPDDQERRPPSLYGGPQMFRDKHDTKELKEVWEPKPHKE